MSTSCTKKGWNEGQGLDCSRIKVIKVAGELVSTLTVLRPDTV